MSWIKKVNRKHANRRFLTMSREEVLAQSERDEQEIIAALESILPHDVLRPHQDIVRDLKAVGAAWAAERVEA